MNERMKELMLEAGYAAPEIAGRANKLAELIIMECARLCDNHGDKVEDARPNKDLSSAAFDCSDIIREHFGVEE
jgi:hypothetical protein